MNQLGLQLNLQPFLFLYSLEILLHLSPCPTYTSMVYSNEGKTMSNLNFAFPNQQKAWAEIERTIQGLEQARIVLLAQPQVGKTGTMLVGAIQQAKKAQELGMNYVNIIAISDANNALCNQTRADLAHALQCAGMTDQANRFIVEHRSNLKHLKLPVKACGQLTVFTDEAHIAAAQNAQRDEFQTRVYAYEGPRLIVDVGATSFAQIALHHHAESPYNGVVVLEPGPAYNSIKHMYEMGRIRQVDKLCSMFGDPTPFLADRVDTLQRHGGYTLIRATGKKHIAVIRALRLLAPTMPIIEADMFKQAVAGTHLRIADIPTQLSIHPKRPTILLVRGALRVGIVLKPSLSNNICEMVDTNAARADTVTQAFLGRSCGYHKGNDCYSIFTNLRDVETIIDFYDDVKGAIPVGLKNTGAAKGGSYQLVPLHDAYDMAKNQGYQVSRCSANNEHDVADEVMRNIDAWQGRLVYLDEANDKHLKSWAWLVATRPDLVGQFVTFNRDTVGYSGAKVDENFLDLKYMVDSEAAE